MARTAQEQKDRPLQRMKPDPDEYRLFNIRKRECALAQGQAIACQITKMTNEYSD